MTEHGVLTLTSVESGLRFDARFKDASMKFESCKGHTEVNPMEALLASLACCEAMDVIEILRKKRQQVTAYEIRMEGMRSEEHPRRYIAITLVHRITGHGVDRTAVEHAMALSSEKYCSVHHSLAKDIVFSQRAEVIEAA